MRVKFKDIVTLCAVASVMVVANVAIAQDQVRTESESQLRSAKQVEPAVEKQNRLRSAAHAAAATLGLKPNVEGTVYPERQSANTRMIKITSLAGTFWMVDPTPVVDRTGAFTIRKKGN